LDARHTLAANRRSPDPVTSRSPSLSASATVATSIGTATVERLDVPGVHNSCVATTNAHPQSGALDQADREGPPNAFAGVSELVTPVIATPSA
jgi:hypothetical protein